MADQDSDFLRHLITENWLSVEIYRRAAQTNAFPRIVFHTPKTSVCFSGEDHMPCPKCDVFSLKLTEFDRDTWEPEITPRLFPPENVFDFVKLYADEPLSRLFSGPRQARFFTSEDFSESMLATREATLMRCIAVELFIESEPEARMLIAEEGMSVSLHIGQDCEQRIKDYFIEYRPL